MAGGGSGSKEKGWDGLLLLVNDPWWTTGSYDMDLSDDGADGNDDSTWKVIDCYIDSTVSTWKVAGQLPSSSLNMDLYTAAA